ncbi:FecR domain-containing protein [Pedobacter sp. AW31-3R]|uniref:FecR domain-containing protein n=1 Tax=Pedobacter sp. AW31-3R TaxID=3445781 RepID=UPI003FA07B75
MNIDTLIHYVTNEASPEERIAVEQWCRQDNKNQQELENLQQVWNITAPTLSRPPADAVASLIRFKEKAATHKKTRVIPLRKKYDWRTWMKVAAVFAGIPLMIWFFMLRTSPVKELTATTSSQIQTTLLADGSTVVLNKNSMLKYPESFTGKTRTVSLNKGEAFFKVSHDKTRPFFVRVNGMQIKVVGTAFNVKVNKGRTEVIVESGKVEVDNHKNHILLSPAESVLVHPSDVRLQKEKHTDLLYNYYRSKEFIADGTPLWKLCEVLEEAYEVKISFQQTALRDLPMNATFKNESLDDILSVIAKTFNLKVTRKDKQILFNLAK